MRIANPPNGDSSHARMICHLTARGDAQYRSGVTPLARVELQARGQASSEAPGMYGRGPVPAAAKPPTPRMQARGPPGRAAGHQGPGPGAPCHWRMPAAAGLSQWSRRRGPRRRDARAARGCHAAQGQSGGCAPSRPRRPGPRAHPPATSRLLRSESRPEIREDLKKWI